MSTATTHPVLSYLTRHRGLLFPASAAALIFVLLIPLPTAALDFLLLSNLLLSTIVLMTVMYLRTPLEFSSFPSLLLALTLFRLVLNTATTRLILSNGDQGTSAAGHVVEAFGLFVAANSLAVGVIIFLIVTVIQFVVITKGATRIAEVAARFTLDGMPGKQMAIDADLNAGTIDEAEAKRRRSEVTREADFYGAMDGASKFVRGDAIAGILITFVNILGGLYVGMVDHQMTLVQSLDIFTKLTIGDGLASQVPAFIVSVAAGMLVTRSTGQTNLGEEVLGQLLAKPIALLLAAGFLLILGLTPLPKVPLAIMAGGCGVLAYVLHRAVASAATTQAAQQQARKRSEPERVEPHLVVDPLELQVGFALVRLVDRTRGGDLLDRIAALRKQIALELGLVVPPIRIRDNATLPPQHYVFLLRGQEIARGELYPTQALAMDAGLAEKPIHGTEVREPAFGLRAWWIDPQERASAENMGYTVVDASTVLATHLTEMIRRHAAELLTRSGTQALLDTLKQRHQGLVDEVVPALLRAGDLQRILQNLLRERVPIRDLETILETLGDWAPRSKDPEILTEYVRNALARTLCAQYADKSGTIHCVSLDPATEDYLLGNIQRLEVGSTLLLPPEDQAALALKLRRSIEQAAGNAAGAPIVVLCSPQVRLWTRRILEPALPQTAVLSLNEIIRGVNVQNHGVVSLEPERADVPSLVHA